MHLQRSKFCPFFPSQPLRPGTFHVTATLDVRWCSKLHSAPFCNVYAFSVDVRLILNIMSFYDQLFFDTVDLLVLLLRIVFSNRQSSVKHWGQGLEVRSAVRTGYWGVPKRLSIRDASSVIHQGRPRQWWSQKYQVSFENQCECRVNELYSE